MIKVSLGLSRLRAMQYAHVHFHIIVVCIKKMMLEGKIDDRSVIYKCHRFCSSPRKISTRRCYLMLVDVGYLKHTRLGWSCLPLVIIDVSLRMCTRHDSCVHAWKIFHPFSNVSLPKNKSLALHYLTIQMSPNRFKHTTSYTCKTLKMLHFIEELCLPDVHMPC